MTVSAARFVRPSPANQDWDQVVENWNEAAHRSLDDLGMERDKKAPSWWSKGRRAIQPLYYSTMRGKRDGVDGWMDVVDDGRALLLRPAEKKQAVQALHYGGGRGKRAEVKIEEGRDLGPCELEGGLGKRDGLQSLYYSGGRGKRGGSPF